QTRVTQGDAKLNQLAAQLNSNGKTIVIQGYADSNVAGADQRALDRANLVRNQLIDQGVPPAQVKVEAKVQPGQRDHVQIVAEPVAAADATKNANGQAQKPDNDAPP